MADVWEKDLAQKSSLTVNDFLRVVGADNVSYKQAISGFMGTIGVDKMVNGATNPSVSSFAELKESAFYTIGNAPNYSDAPATGYGLLCVFNGGAYRTQTYYAFHSGETYYRISTNSGSTWNAWTKQPTRAEVNALKEKFTFYDDTTANDASALCLAKFNLVVSKGAGSYFINGGWKSRSFGFSVVSVLNTSPARGIVVFVGQDMIYHAYINDGAVALIYKVTETAI